MNTITFRPTTNNVITAVAVTLLTTVTLSVTCNIRFFRRKRAQQGKLQMIHGTKGNDKKIVVCVTGGLGFLGREIVKQLLADGKYAVRVFDQAKPVAATVDERVTYVTGTLQRSADLAVAFEGVDAVIHTAALLGPLGVTRQDLLRVNVKGTEAVVLACFLQRVKRLVVTSSVAAVLHKAGPNAPPQHGTEDEVSYPAQEQDHLEPYGYSKRLVEDIVLSANRASAGLSTCVLRPSIIFGKHDGKLAQRMLQGLDQNLVGDGAHPVDVVHVTDVAKAHVLALEGLNAKPTEVGGKVFFVGSGRPTLVRSFFNNWGHAKEFQSVPVPVVRMFAKINTMVWTLFKWAPLGVWLNDDAISLLITPWYFSVDKAHRVLGYNPEDPQVAKQRLVDEWRAEHKL